MNIESDLKKLGEGINFNVSYFKVTALLIFLLNTVLLLLALNPYINKTFSNLYAIFLTLYILIQWYLLDKYTSKKWKTLYNQGITKVTVLNSLTIFSAVLCLLLIMFLTFQTGFFFNCQLYPSCSFSRFQFTILMVTLVVIFIIHIFNILFSWQMHSRLSDLIALSISMDCDPDDNGLETDLNLKIGQKFITRHRYDSAVKRYNLGSYTKDSNFNKKKSRNRTSVINKYGTKEYSDSDSDDEDISV